MGPTIFYSWQSDTPSGLNRGFIRTCLDRAVKQLVLDAEIDESPRIDSGMEGISGTPEVATVMFTKIGQSHILVADATLVGSIPSPQIPDSKILTKLQTLVLNRFGLKLHRAIGEEKRVPNSNVVLEMGYAAGVLGWGRIICVMNEHFGKREQQPFDVRNRRFPINYTLNRNDSANRKEVQDKLVSSLKTAIKTVLENEISSAREAIKSFDENCFYLAYTFATWEDFSETVFRRDEYKSHQIQFSAAVIRLLESRLLRTEHNSDTHEYAYHWTPLGKEVLRLLGRRP